MEKTENDATCNNDFKYSGIKAMPFVIGQFLKLLTFFPAFHDCQRQTFIYYLLLILIMTSPLNFLYIMLKRFVLYLFKIKSKLLCTQNNDSISINLFFKNKKFKTI